MILNCPIYGELIHTLTTNVAFVACTDSTVGLIVGGTVVGVLLMVSLGVVLVLVVVLAKRKQRVSTDGEKILCL